MRASCVHCRSIPHTICICAHAVSMPQSSPIHALEAGYHVFLCEHLPSAYGILVLSFVCMRAHPHLCLWSLRISAIEAKGLLHLKQAFLYTCTQPQSKHSHTKSNSQGKGEIKTESRQHKRKDRSSLRHRGTTGERGRARRKDLRSRHRNIASQHIESTR